MPMKSCGSCHKIVPLNHMCPVIRKQRNTEDAKREEKKIYKNIKWRRLRLEVLDYQEYVCLWSLYIDGVIRQANIVHHIIEILVDDSKAYDIDNVIGLCKAAHDDIHVLYKTNKKDTIALIKECNRLWHKGIRAEGLGTLRVPPQYEK